MISPPALTGLPGLPSADLVEIGYALALAGSAVDGDVVARVGEEVQRRGLVGRLLDHRAERMLSRPGAEIGRAEAESDARAWLERAFSTALGRPCIHPGDWGPPYW